MCAASGITSTLAWTLLNSGVALFGYYASAWLIDDINWGRYRIQVSTFLLSWLPLQPLPECPRTWGPLL
jgi:hypothetical protein